MTSLCSKAFQKEECNDMFINDDADNFTIEIEYFF
jgi:hypothetical protein